MTHEIKVTTTIDAVPTPRRVRATRYDDGTHLGEVTTDNNGEGTISVPDASPAWLHTADDYGDPWAAETTKTIGAQVFPTTANGHYYEAETGGSTGTVEPDWPTDGGTVTDGDITWRDIGTMIAPEIEGPFIPTPV